MKWHPRFSLGTLLLTTLLLASAALLWSNREPWYLERTVFTRQEQKGESVFSKDGRLVASFSDDPNFFHGMRSAKELPFTLELNVRDTATGKVVTTFADLPPRIWSVEFSEDSRLLLTTSPHCGIIWDVQSGKKVRELETENKVFGTFVPGTSLVLLYSDSDHSIDEAEFFDVATGLMMPTTSLKYSRKRFWITERRQLISVDSGGQISIFEYPPPTLANFFAFPALNTIKHISVDGPGLSGAVMMRDKSQLWTKDFGGEVSVYDTSTWKVLRRTTTPILAWEGAEFSPDGKCIVAGWGGLGEIASDLIQIPQSLNLKLNYYDCIAFGPNSDRLFATETDAPNTIVVSDLHANILARLKPTNPTPSVSALKPLADGTHLSAIDRNKLLIYARRRPEQWWGLIWLPEFWLTFLLTAATLRSITRDRKQLGPPLNDK